MDIIQVLLITGVVAGLVIVILSFFGPKRNGIPDKPPLDMILDKRLEVMDTTISEADNIITELNGMSQNVINEMDQKYTELLFLYNLIDEKKKAIETAPIIAFPGAMQLKQELKPDHKPKPKTLNPRSARILELSRSGMSVAQIAKELDMGQGEVSLIMSMSKD
ncbi:MAG: DUF742 domain-containing protein [Defluviitaleaceae bacterium]|nr:DUF742 domain-containing protein [Defluviitaleaceae bacterium]MCL2835728.1 DUF742 domain-containing protein [Defluviitaleaceae bacterium]